MLDDMVRVLIDVEKFVLRPDRPKRKWGSCKLNSGRWELLEPARRRRHEKCSRLRKDAMNLAIHGSSMKPRRPRKGECPNGTDGLGDPRFDAVSLLSAAPVVTQESESAVQGSAGRVDEGSEEESDESCAVED